MDDQVTTGLLCYRCLTAEYVGGVYLRAIGQAWCSQCKDITLHVEIANPCESALSLAVQG